MELAAATGALQEQILDSTYPVWHEGLTRRAYGQLNSAQMRTTWGARHLQRVALVDGSGALLSSAKRYLLDARFDGRDVRVCGIGAVFTPAPLRGRGYASELIERLVAREAAEGAELALLFSEIGPSFYERLSFRPVPVDEVTLSVQERAGVPAMLVRGGSERDLPDLAAMHQVRSAAARFALRRSPEFIQFALARKRLRAGLGPSGDAQVEFHVAEEGSSAVAYVVITATAQGWTLDEAGDRDPAAARLGAILEVLLGREPAARRPTIRAWWPRAMAVPPQVLAVDRRDARDVMMLRPLNGSRIPADAAEVFYWRGDFF